MRVIGYCIAVLVLLGTCVSQAAAGESSFVPPMDRLYENRLQAESADYLSLNLYNHPVDPRKAADAQQYSITSSDDPDYRAPTHPSASGSRTRAVRVSLRKELLVKHTAIFLKLPKPLKNGKTYSIKVGQIAEQAVPELAPLIFDDQRQINDNLRVNQLGYLPEMAKYAYLGQYMGDLGPMPFSAAKFEVVNEQGTAVFSGAVKTRGISDEHVGQTVYDLDFSALNAPGTYRLRVPGVGLSYPFYIGRTALNPSFINLMRGHYQQRCGQEITPEFSRHTREACHLDDAWLEERVEKLGFIKPKNPPLYPTQYDGKFHSAVHGHHDAGDYGKYTNTGATYVFSIALAYEVFGEKLMADNLGLPWSGNGIPDLLEECKWELDWLENMQDADGGVFGVIKPNTGGYENHMPQREAHRLFYPKDTPFTGAYAAALAHASRNPELRKHYPQDCDRYLAKAKKAWEWLQKADHFVQYFHYGAEFGDWDERCWAAAELYAATGDAAYHDYFLKNFRPDEKRWSWWGMFDGVGNAVNAYVFMKDRQRDPAMLGRCEEALRDTCRMHLEDASASPYRLSIPQPSVRFKAYGWYFPGDLAGWNLLMGYALDKDPRYLQCAADNMGYTYGANPSGYFLQTGLGLKRNIEMVSDVANSDNIIEPVSGAPLGIGSAGFYWLAKYEKRIAEGTYPAEWPLLNRWYDGFNVETEFTMGPMVRETIVAAYFADVPKDAGKRPTVKIKADRTSGAAPLIVNFDIETDIPASSIRQVFWDFGDESFSVQRAPQHQFTEAGRSYPVGVSIIDENGYWAYATDTVSAVMEKAPFPQTERAADAGSIAIYHFNGDLKDAAGKAPELKAETKVPERKHMQFSSDPPMWMERPSGSCLVLDGAEHFSAEIPATVLPDPSATPLTIEMMVYVQEFAGWGYPGNPMLLGLKNEWDSWLGWLQDTWDKAGAPKFANIPAERFAKEFPRNRWSHVKIAYDGKGTSRFLVDGKEWGTREGVPFKASVRKPLVLSVGPFKGMVDELVVRQGSN